MHIKVFSIAIFKSDTEALFVGQKNIVKSTWQVAMEYIF